MTHTHFRCSKPILCCSKKKMNKVPELYRVLRPVNLFFKGSIVTETWIEKPASLPFPPSPWSFQTPTSMPDHIPSPLPPPAPLNTPSLKVSWPSLSPPPRWSPWQLAGSGWPQSASDQALWPEGKLSGAAGIQCATFEERCKYIYRRGCLRNPVASRFGARLAEEKTGRPRRVWPEATKQYSLPHIAVVIERNLTVGGRHSRYSLNWLCSVCICRLT